MQHLLVIHWDAAYHGKSVSTLIPPCWSMCGDSSNRYRLSTQEAGKAAVLMVPPVYIVRSQLFNMPSSTWLTRKSSNLFKLMMHKIGIQ